MSNVLMMKEFEKEYLTPKEAAKLLRTTEGTLATWRSTGQVKLPYIKLGNKVLYPSKELKECMYEHRY